MAFEFSSDKRFWIDEEDKICVYQDPCDNFLG